MVVSRFFTNFAAETYNINIIGYEETIIILCSHRALNKQRTAGCDNLWSISIQCTDIETVTIKDLPEFGEATVSNNDIRKLTVENCPKLVYLDCQDNKLPELHIKKCKEFWRIFATNNYMRTLIRPR